jgi:outer membrane protein assembly factor BamE (lipoprotein component of BamABCDE complex)
MKKLIVLGVAGFVLGGCSEYQNHGYTVLPHDLAKIKVGHSTKEEVGEVLGSPTVSSEYGDNTYYYVSNRSRKRAFFAPKLVEQHIVAIVFNSRGVVSQVNKYDLKDRNKFIFANDEVVIKGNELGVAEQIMTNVGRFDQPSKRDR